MRTYKYLKTLAIAGLIASAAVLALSAGVAQADCVGPYCSGPTGANIQAQQAAASQAVQLANQISNPVQKAVVLDAVKLSNQLANNVNTLLAQAAAASNPQVKAALTRAAVAESVAAKALAQLALSFAKAVLRAEGKAHTVLHENGVQGHASAKLSPQAVQKQVKVYLNQATVLSRKASALNKQAAKLLRGRRPSKANQNKANKLIAQAKTDAAKAQALNLKGQRLLAGKPVTTSAQKTVTLPARSTKTINVGYPDALAVPGARYSCKATVSGLGKRFIKILSRGSALGGTVCRVKAKNTASLPSLDTTGRVTVTATTTY